MSKYKDKFRVESARWRNWDYRSSGKYFITIKTKRKMHYFGRIKNKKPVLSDIGGIAEKCWLDIPNHCDIVKLDSFVIMPNHIHGIIHIKDSNKCFSKENLNAYFSPVSIVKPHIISGMTMHFCFKAEKYKPYHFRFRNPGKKSLSSIIGSYKSAVSKQAHLINPGFGWQERFHDRIIRNEKEYLRIKKYILGNPENWLD